VSDEQGAASGPAAITAVIVDDTPDIRLLTRMALEMDNGIRVVAEADNGLAGIDVVAAHQPDVVILDMAMPVMDGLEALPHMKRASPRTRVLVVSGFDPATVLASAAEAGADGYLQKGAAPATLVERVHEVAGLPSRAPDPSTSDRSARLGEGAPAGLDVGHR
jgi:DNA-binding NarL/FixJ family response regulator